MFSPTLSLRDSSRMRKVGWDVERDGTGVGLVEFVGVDVRVCIWGDAAACVYEERVSATNI
eukprot:scaffold27307_cov63-Phaeocystis_antarctica.AAC.1